MNNHIIFNSLLDQLLNYLEKTFKNNASDIRLAKGSLAILRKIEPQTIPIKFLESISYYEKEVFEFNEKFFLELKLDGDNGKLLESLNLKRIWSTPNITDTQKAMVFIYFQKLITVSKIIRTE